MLTIEEIAKRIAGPGGAAGCFLVGGLLAFVPIINVVSLGYVDDALTMKRLFLVSDRMIRVWSARALSQVY